MKFIMEPERWKFYGIGLLFRLLLIPKIMDLKMKQEQNLQALLANSNNKQKTNERHIFVFIYKQKELRKLV